MKVQTVFQPKEIEGLKVFNDSTLECFRGMVETLNQDESIARFEWGDSLHPIVKNGQYVKISPVTKGKIKEGDCVFCLIPMIGYMVHMVQRISTTKMHGRQYLIGDSMNTPYGWTSEQYIFGKAEPIPYFEDNTKYFMEKNA